MRKLLKDMSNIEKKRLLHCTDTEILGKVKGCPEGTENKKCSSTSDCIKCIKNYLSKRSSNS